MTLFVENATLVDFYRHLHWRASKCLDVFAADYNSGSGSRDRDKTLLPSRPSKRLQQTTTTTTTIPSTAANPDGVSQGDQGSLLFSDPSATTTPATFFPWSTLATAGPDGVPQEVEGSNPFSDLPTETPPSTMSPRRRNESKVDRERPRDRGIPGVNYDNSSNGGVSVKIPKTNVGKH